MKKVMIIGSPGAGKSTFARELRDITGLPLYYLDMIWHKPDKTHISREEFDMRLRELAALDEWIIDGNYSRTLELRLCACDTVFLLDFPTELCLAGAKSRIGHKREDLPWFEQEFDEEFRQFILNFPHEQRPVIYEMLDKYQKNKKIIVFRTRAETEEYLEKLGLPQN